MLRLGSFADIKGRYGPTWFPLLTMCKSQKRKSKTLTLQDASPRSAQPPKRCQNSVVENHVSGSRRSVSQQGISGFCSSFFFDKNHVWSYTLFYKIEYSSTSSYDEKDQSK